MKKKEKTASITENAERKKDTQPSLSKPSHPPKKLKRVESFPSVLEVVLLNFICCGFIGYVRLGQTSKGVLIGIFGITCLLLAPLTAGLTGLAPFLLIPAVLIDSFMCAQYQLETGVPLEEYTFFPIQR